MNTSKPTSKAKSKVNPTPQVKEKTEEEILNDKYVEQLDDIHKVAYLIAKDHLGSSFDLIKSIGFNEWNKK
tara:strand:+ start:15215 stop:15427 length:213 start_codon:yes stop_codon:yes gene_type:complete